MHSIYKRGRCWWVSCYYGGKRSRKSLRTAIKRIAEQRAQESEEKLFGGISNSTWKDFEREFLSWVQAHVKPSTLKKYEFLTHRFSRFLFEYKPRITTLSQLSPSLISEYVQDRRLPFTLTG